MRYFEILNGMVMLSLLWRFHAGIVHNRNSFNEYTRFSHFNLGGFQLIRAPLFWWEFNLLLPASPSVIQPGKTLMRNEKFWWKVKSAQCSFHPMCQPVFVEIIYMLPNWSEHKANCLTVKADCVCLQCDHLPRVFIFWCPGPISLCLARH